MIIILFNIYKNIKFLKILLLSNINVKNEQKPVIYWKK